MNQFERAFIFMIIALHIGMFIKVGYESQKWMQVEFIFAYFVCILVFIQFLIRYLAITHLYKTETSISSWTVSLLIVITSLVLIQSTLNFPLWFLFYGVLLLLASLKTRQAIAQVMSASEVNTERGVRLQEFMILESGFGVFMILFYIFPKIESMLFPQLTLENTIFFGTLFAAYYSLFSTIIMIMRMFKNKEMIEKHMENLT